VSTRPFFLTGANAVIMLNNKSVAYATDISYSITVKHATPRVLGRFEVETIQPLSYDVEGTLTIIKYARGMKDYIGTPPVDANQAGNGVGSYSAGQGMLAGALGLPSGGTFDGGTADNFNPSRMFQSKMFDIEIRQKLPGNDTGKKDLSSPLSKVQDFFQGLNEGLVAGGAGDAGSVPVVRLRDCRFSGLDYKLTKRGLPLVTMQFKARYVDDDTYIASKSGVGQELS